jgi:hypothetical protein
MVRNELFIIPSQGMAEITAKILQYAFRIHAHRGQVGVDSERILDEKGLGMNDDSPMIADL